MTRKDTLDAIKALGMSARYSTEWGEYRVTLRAEDEPSRERREAMAYYTDDAKDALGTARAMRETFDQQQAAKAEAAERTAFTVDDIPPSPLYEQTERGTFRVTDAARAGIEALAAALPAAERQTEAEATFKARVDGEWLEGLSKGDAARHALYNLNGQTGEFSYSLDFSEDSGTHQFIKTQHFVNEAGDDVTDFVRQTVLHESASLSAVQSAIIESDSWNIRKEGPRSGAAVSVEREPLPDNDPTPPRGNGGAALPRPNREPSEAEVTRHMMTGEEPRTASPLDKARERNNTPEAKAARLAERQAMPSRGYDGPEL